jgi:hemolysin activation/secretion protein
MTLTTLLARRGALPVLLATTTLLVASQAMAQGIGGAVRESEETRRAAPQLRATPALVLPRLVEPQLTLKDKETLFIRSFKVEGDSPVDLTNEIHALLAPYENRKLTIAQIYEVADAISTLYRDRGYILAKAYVPAQKADNGVLRFKLVVGKYGTRTINNESLVRDSFVQGVIDHALGTSPYVHKDELERAMLLISDLAGAGVPRVAIETGRKPETSDFVFGVPPGRRLDGYLLADNFGSPFTGRNRLSGGLNFNSPLGYGDRLSMFGIVSEHDDLVNGRIAYSAPLGYDGLRAEVAAFRTTYTLGGIYNVLNATGTADGASAILTYAVKRQRDDSIYLTGGYTHKSLNDNVFGISIANRTIDLGTMGITRDTAGAIFGLPLITSTTFSFTEGNVNYPDATQRAINIAGVDTVGNYTKINLSYNGTLALSEKWSLSAYIRGQKSFGKNLDSSEQMSLTGFWGVRSFDEGLAGDTGYLVTPELKYALPDIGPYRHSIGLFTDVGGVWLENASFTTTQKPFTQLNDVGLGYYATYEYSPGRVLLLKALVAQTYGSNSGAQSYDKGTKGLIQVGSTF